jgi:DNA-binding beta-propeller fold protein YncE
MNLAEMVGRRIRPGALVVSALAASLLCAISTPAPADEAPILKTRLVLWRYADRTAFEQPRGIAFDPSDGALYVGNSGDHRIEVFSKTGRALAQFVHRVSRPDGSIIDGTPTGLAFDRAGHLLVVDLGASYVDVLDRRGRFLCRLEIPVGQPNAVAVGSDGTIYVGTTTEVTKVYRFRPDYRADGSWGEEGTGPGHLFGLNALWVMKDGSVATACTRTDLAIQIFSPSGQYLRGFGTHEVGDGNFSFPSGLVATADGRIWVIDEIRQTLQVFDEQGNLVTKTGQRGDGPGEFAHPSSLTSDGRGLIALTDRELGRVQVFGISDE